MTTSGTRTTLRQFALLCAIATVSSEIKPEDYSVTGSPIRGPDLISGSGVEPEQTAVSIPTCSTDDEFLTSDGQRLVCRKIPPCTCLVDGAEPSRNSTAPSPPTGCPVYNPPLRGATTCYLNSTENLMFCSVYCDHNFEFLSTPHNPYFCGSSTDFQWIDATRRPNVFPECTAHRITIGTIHSILNYLPSPCYGLSDNTILAIMSDFSDMLRNIGHTASVEDIFMQCPSFDGRVYHYNEVTVRATHKRRKRYVNSERESNTFKVDTPGD